MWLPRLSDGGIGGWGPALDGRVLTTDGTHGQGNAQKGNADYICVFRSDP